MNNGEVKNRALSAHQAALELSHDLEEAAKYLSQHDNGFTRRSYVRALFAYVEAASHVMRLAATDLILQRANVRRFRDTQALVLLAEREGVIKDNGAMKIRARGQRPFVPTLAFTLRTLAEELGESTDFFSKAGWEQMQRALQVRNRLTHPKQLSDVEVSDDDLQIVADSAEWFDQNGTRLLTLHTKKLDSRRS